MSRHTRRSRSPYSRDRSSRDNYSSRYDRSDHRNSRYESSSSRRHRSRSRDSERRSFSRRDDERSGYKRRRDSPTAEPPKKKRKSSAWDDVPEGLDGLSKQEICARLAQQAPLPGSVSTVTAIPGYMPMSTQANTPFIQAKRLYIGNIPPTATEDDLKNFFRNQYISTGFADPNSEVVQAVQIRYERNFAFIEVENADLATKGIGFDGISFLDHTLKVRRPRDYQGPDVNQIGLIPGIVSTNVPDTPNKVFVGGLPSALTEDQVKDLVGYFGELKAFHLVKDNTTNVSKGFAFFEYLDEKVTDVACRALNGKEVGGKNLLVQRAHLGSRTVNQVSFEMGNSESVLGCLLNLAMQVTTTLAANDLATPPEPTNILVLMNVINIENLIEGKANLDFIKADLTNECSNYGHVKSIHIPVAPSEDEFDRTRGIGKVFIEFDNVNEAQDAQKALSVKSYANRCVYTTYLDTDLFEKGFYDGPEDAGTEAALDKLQKQFQSASNTDQSDDDDNDDQPRIQNYHSVPPPMM